MKANALARAKKPAEAGPNWQNPKQQNHLGLMQVSSEATRDGMIRAAKIHQVLRHGVFLALRGTWEFWRAMTAHPSLALRKCPREKVEVFEEYRSLQENHLLSMIVRK